MKAAPTVALVSASLLVGGCGRAPLNYLHGAGIQAQSLAQLAWGLGLISLLVVLIIAFLLAAAIMRRRDAVGDEALAVRRDGGGMPWIYIGLATSVPALLAMTVWTLLTIGAVAAPPTPPKLTIAVTGERWFWSVRYLDPQDPARSFATANQIVIPTGQPIRLLLSSSDVIHSFWVPKLGGKMDMIPGKTNIHWIEADQPGLYRGQCAEYCGLQHAKMAFDVLAMPPAKFEQWRSVQLSNNMRQPLGLALAQAGGRVFSNHCAACHAIRGTGAGAIAGPDLSHFGSRATIAAGSLPNTPGNLAYWIGHTQQVKPGAEMPPIALTPKETAQVTAFLEAL